jgi:hypothetical protein
MTQGVKHLPSKYEALSSNLSIAKKKNEVMGRSSELKAILSLISLLTSFYSLCSLQKHFLKHNYCYTFSTH